MKTTKKKFNYKGLVLRAFSYINKTVLEGKNLKEIKEGLREIVNSYFGLNRNERYDMFYECYKVARAAKRNSNPQRYLSLRKSFDTILKSARRTKGSYELRTKRRATREALDNENTIFFICSKHPNCAEGHKEFEHRILCDRYWRTKVVGFDYYRVWSYIKNHNVMTVQESMKGPYYLTTRKYCRHILIPLNTNEVLGSSARKLGSLYGNTYEQSYTPDVYYDLRERVYSKLNKETPCKWYKKRGN